MNLPEQECVGEWCPVFLNLWRPSRECIGRYDNIKVISLNPELFSRLSEIGRIAIKSGVRLRQFLSS
jgi:hypothetical protein